MQVELASGKDLNTSKGPNTQVPAKCSLSKQIVSQLLYKYVWLTQILQALLLGTCVGRLKKSPYYYYYYSGCQWALRWEGGTGERVTYVLLDRPLGSMGPTKEGRSRRGPAPRDSIDLLEFYIILSGLPTVPDFPG